MGNVYDAGGFVGRVNAPPREHHRVPHAHITSANGGEVLIFLGDDETAPSLWQNHGMRKKDVRDAVPIGDG